MKVCTKIAPPIEADIFATMENRPAPESDKIAQQLLEDDKSIAKAIKAQYIF